MPLYTAEALVLRTYKLGEADRIVVFLTRDRGKKRGVARSARRLRSRFGGALEPLTHVRVAYFEKERRELVSLNYAEPMASPLGAPEAALGYSGYFAELLDEAAPEADPNERLYRLGASVVETLADRAPVEPLARYFEYWLLRLQGVYPPHVACQRCGGGFRDEPDGSAWLSPGDGVLMCARCHAGEGGRTDGPRLSPRALLFLDAARTLGPGEAAARPVAQETLGELEAVHRLLIARHLEREPRSARVLRELRRAPGLAGPAE